MMNVASRMPCDVGRQAVRGRRRSRTARGRRSSCTIANTITTVIWASASYGAVRSAHQVSTGSTMNTIDGKSCGQEHQRRQRQDHQPLQHPLGSGGPGWRAGAAGEERDDRQLRGAGCSSARRAPAAGGSPHPVSDAGERTPPRRTTTSPAVAPPMNRARSPVVRRSGRTRRPAGEDPPHHPDARRSMPRPRPTATSRSRPPNQIVPTATAAISASSTGVRGRAATSRQAVAAPIGQIPIAVPPGGVAVDGQQRRRPRWQRAGRRRASATTSPRTHPLPSGTAPDRPDPVPAHLDAAAGHVAARPAVWDYVGSVTSARSSYDVVVVGGGHNGLVAAAYLARAGLSILVLERLATGGAGAGVPAAAGCRATPTWSR